MELGTVVKTAHMKGNASNAFESYFYINEEMHHKVNTLQEPCDWFNVI